MEMELDEVVFWLGEQAAFDEAVAEEIKKGRD